MSIYYRNALRYWRKHNGSVGASLFRLLVATGMLLRLAVSPFRTDRSGERRGAVHGFARVLYGTVAGTWAGASDPHA